MKPALKYNFYFTFLGSICLLLLYSCEQPLGFASTTASEEKILQEGPSFEPQKMPVIITYHLDSITTSEAIDSFQTTYSEDAKKVIFALNRMDPDRLRANSLLVIPDTITSNFMDYAPFPATFEMFEKIPKTVLISRRVQAFGLYEQGRLIRWGPVSSGKQSTPTPAGLFYGNYKAKRKISTVNDAWIMPYYFNFMNYYGVGVHQYTLPGYPASHACVRLYKEDAMMIYDWAQQWQLSAGGREILKNGTPFMVFGDYDFGNPSPWLSLAENYNSNYLTGEEMGILKGYVDLYFKDKRNFEIFTFPESTLAMPPEESLETIK